MAKGRENVRINRAPVLTLWGMIVAEHLGFDEDEAATLGKCLAGLNAQRKARSLGIVKPAAGEGGAPAKKAGLGEEFWVEICGRPLPAKKTKEGVRAVVKDKPIDPASVHRYLSSKFGDALPVVRETMEKLAGAYDPDDLAAEAYALYERFRPAIPRGKRGWGAKGDLDLALLRSLRKE